MAIGDPYFTNYVTTNDNIYKCEEEQHGIVFTLDGQVHEYKCGNGENISISPMNLFGEKVAIAMSIPDTNCAEFKALDMETQHIMLVLLRKHMITTIVKCYRDGRESLQMLRSRLCGASQKVLEDNGVQLIAGTEKEWLCEIGLENEDADDDISSILARFDGIIANCDDILIRVGEELETIAEETTSCCSIKLWSLPQRKIGFGY